MTWPIFTDDGCLAVVRAHLEDCQPYQNAADLTEKAVEALKRCLAHHVDSVMEVVYVGGALNSCAGVWVVNREDDYPRFDLVWNYMSVADLLSLRGLPEDFLEKSFSPAELPDDLALTKRQQELISARQKAEDTSALLDCLETIQDLLVRRPGFVRLAVSEETAISLLAAYGETAANALKGFARYPDR